MTAKKKLPESPLDTLEREREGQVHELVRRQEVITALISIAADLVSATYTPSVYRADWPKRVTWAEVSHRLEHSEECMRQLGIRVRKLADDLRDA